MVRKLKDNVGVRCSVCKSDAVYRYTDKGYTDHKKHWSVVCSNPDCQKITPGYNSPEAALRAWKSSWGEVRVSS